jgi:hypothetical protein
MYRALTRDIEVVVEPFYLEEQSDPDDDRYVWGYRIVISNNSELSVKLVNRYWNITDQNGVVDEVTGPGVVGEQPRLEPHPRRRGQFIRHARRLGNHRHACLAQRCANRRRHQTVRGKRAGRDRHRVDED